MSKNQDQIMNEIFKEYNLVYSQNDPKNSDIFISPKFKIITRTGVDKIEAKLNVKASFDVITATTTDVAIKGTFTASDKTVTTIGEASSDIIDNIVLSKEVTTTENGVTTSKSESYVHSVLVRPGNVKQNPPYLYAMAEKRARARGVLRLAGLYELGFYSEDEADGIRSEADKQRFNSSNVSAKRIQ